MLDRRCGGNAAVAVIALVSMSSALSASNRSVTVQVSPAGEPWIDRAALRSAVSAAGEGSVTVTGFPLGDGRRVDLELRRFHVTGPATKFVVGGTLRPLAYDAGRVTLLRGHVAKDPQTSAFVAVTAAGGVARIDGRDGTHVVPLAGADGALPVHRAASGLPPVEAFCAALPAGGVPASAGGGSVAGVAFPQSARQIELAVETDYEYYQLFNDLDAAGDYVVALYGAVSDVYLRDVNARFELSFVRLWDDPDDIVNGPDPIGEFRAVWNDTMQAVERDTAQMLSGRRDYPYGGSAWVGVLCNLEMGYSVVGYILGFFDDAVLPSAHSYDIMVTAHELGHNCSVLHSHDYGINDCGNVNGSPERGVIMSYCSQTISGGNTNTDLRFHAIEQEIMETHIFSRPCLAADCNGNGIDDLTDVSPGGGSADLDGNDIPDECQDCNGNSILDSAEIAGGAPDLDGNGFPDECDPDCNGNSVPDSLDIERGAETDAFGNNIPDDCEADCDSNGVSDYSQIMADMDLDVDRDAILDSCQDCDGDGTSDLEELGGAHNVWVAALGTGTLHQLHAVSGAPVSTAGAVVAQPQDLIITPTRRILVSSGTQNRVAEFNATGAFVGNLVAPGSGGLSGAAGMTLRSNGNLVVASRANNRVLEYDGATGAFVGTLVAAGAGGLLEPFAVAFGPNGNLYVASLDDRVRRYDGQTGAFLGVFVTAGSGGLDAPHGMLFAPSGSLLVTSFNTDQVLQYNGTTGAFIGQFNHNGTPTALTLDGPWGIRLGRDGDVYVARHFAITSPPKGDGHEDDHALYEYDIEELHINSTRIFTFDDENGNFLISYVVGNDTGLYLPTGFDFMPDGGADSNGNLVPDACETTPGDVDGDGDVDINDLLDLLAAWGPCPSPPAPCPADIDDNGSVGITDLLTLLANWG